ncbi:MAG TPA: transcription termination factor Rho [Thermoanaerobaculia bacterium]|nr:transcription termination factor Rho [Thermoanaerobaculia bacterium]
MDERDPKERAGAAHDAPAVTEVADAFEEAGPEDGPEEQEPETGGGETGPVPGGAPGSEPFRRRRRRRRRRGRSRFGPAATDVAAPGTDTGTGEGAGRREPSAQAAPPVAVQGILRLHGDHSGLLVSSKEFFTERGDPFVPKHLIEAEDLEDGLLIEAEAAPRGPKGPTVQKITSVEGMTPAEYRTKYVQFHKGISVDPDRRLRMETAADEISGRVLDLVVPIGRGQRCLIVAPPKAGKTFLLKTMANAIAKNDPDVVLFMLLVDERPEEVTDMQRSVQGQVIASPSDMNAARHIAVSELCFERAKRLVEIGKDVVIFCDSITRMSRAYNNEQRGGGKILSGGIDSRTMEKPRRFFGGARNHEDGGSLTIVATCLIDTGSRMDDVIFEEFKGTGNSEIILDRGLFERRVFPCINIPASGTRKEEKLYDADELPKIHKLRRALASVKPVDAMELLLSKLTKFKLNRDFLKSIQ